MNTSFEISKDTTIEWYTPKYILDDLGSQFDLDPATSKQSIILNNSAKNFYTKDDDGLIKDWFGEVFLNPPYSRGLINKFMCKMADHNNGVALIYNRADSKWFQDYVFNKASAIIFLANRIKFIRQDGSIGGSPGTGSVLVAYGNKSKERLINSKLKGKLIILK